MKEKILRKGIKKRLFSIVLALTVTLTVIPTINVYAATCPDCNGSGQIYDDCPECEGEGTVLCPRCGGYATETCQECGGIPALARKCDACDRQGFVVTCDVCEGAGSFTCATCKGETYINLRDCPTCNGSGTVSDHVHDYTGAEWVKDGTGHWHECVKADCPNKAGSKSDIASHSGGTATCQANAVCSVCGASYGEKAAHDYGYSAAGSVITAGCKTSECSESHSITLSAGSDNYSSIEGLAAFNEATGLEVKESDVLFYKVDTEGATEGGYDVKATAPTADGYYYALLTVEDQKAVKAFTIGTPGGSGSGSTCPTCDGNGKIYDDYPECEGEGSVLCPRCGGYATETCQECGGIPALARKCDACDRQGFVVTCDVCEGAGSFTCATCNGEQYVDQDCPTCNGSGTVSDHVHDYTGAEWVKDGTEHWHECVKDDSVCPDKAGSKIDIASHSGGTATCQAKAICSVCGASYGEEAAHDYGYSAAGNVLTASCKTSECSESHSITLSASSMNYSSTAISKEEIFGSIDFTAFNSATGNSLTVNDIKLYAAADEDKAESLDSINGSGSYVAELKVGDETVSCNVLITQMSYTITIPATVKADKEGFNAFGEGIKICNLQNPDAGMAGIKVSAASTNGWKLVKDSSEVKYGLRESESSGSDVTEFTFANDEITGEGKTLACGVFINAADFENAPEGDYTDTITWTISKY